MVGASGGGGGAVGVTMTPPALARAFQAFASGDLAAAERELMQLLRAAPNDINALNLLAGVKRKA